jgi:hypothetical protein
VVEEVTLEEAAGPAEEVARVLWGPESRTTADEMLGADSASAKQPTKTQALADYLRERLTAAGEEGIPSERLIGDALKAGFTKSRSTVYRAKLLLPSVVEFRDPDDPRDPLRWRLGP